MCESACSVGSERDCSKSCRAMKSMWCKAHSESLFFLIEYSPISAIDELAYVSDELVPVPGEAQAV